MKATRIIFAACMFFSAYSGLTAQHMEGMISSKFNYTHFVYPTQKNSDEIKLLNKGFENHPELGTMFSEAPCEDCFEIIEKRTPTTKYFVKENTRGTYIYQQSSTDLMHMMDKNGNYRTIITDLVPHPTQPSLYSADQQPIPVGIDAGKQYTYLGTGENRMIFNNSLELIFTDSLGEIISLGAASWQNHTAGANGVLVKDAWPGIDMEIFTSRGQIKTNFIITKPMSRFRGGELRIRDHINIGNKNHISSKTSGRFHSAVEIADDNSNSVFTINPAVAYDQHSRTANEYSPLDYELSDTKLDIILPEEWFNKTDLTAYPIVIDPLVQGTNSMTIAGSGYNATCFAGGCSYNLALPVPAAITISDIRWSFNYQTTGFLCYMSDGAIDFQLGACRSPAAAGFYWFCNNPSGGTCTGANISIYNHVQTCLPAPNCNTYNLNFTMRFYRCYTSGGGCTNTCIGAASPLTMVVEGRTVEPTSLVTTLPAVTICQGQSTTLTATGQNGVPAYTYTWNPGNLTGSPSVSPAATTTYTVTITDACGNTTTATKLVNVTPGTNPGFTISPNPACIGQTVTISGLGNSAAANYDWLIPNSSSPTVNNTQVPTVTYPAAGTFPITLNFANGSCVFPLVQNITISPNITPTINITASPAGPYCPGATITFTATITNGGTSPSYQWQVNGVNTGTNSSTFSSNTLTAGSSVTCILTSNEPCVTPATVTSNAIVPNIVASLIPTINITAAPGTTICAGTNVTFTANITNGGSNPSYQWQVNGVNAGTNSPTFSSSALTNGNTVTCILTSNDPCANPTTANSNSLVMTVNPVVVPTVTITAAPSGAICAGTNVTFTANITNGGPNPSYQWQVNGVNAGTNSPTFSTNTLTNGAAVTCIVTSNAPCANPVTVTSNSITMVVNPVLTPTVNISANPNGPICSGTNVTFTATITNGGTNPAYQWQINGVNAGTNSASFSTTSLNNGDVVTCILTSNATCASPTTVTSNAISITVTPSVTPSVNITANPTGPICAGSSVTFTATVTNGGTTPVYQWKINGTNVGTNTNTFTSTTLNNGDVISCTLNSNAVCANPATVNSNTITMVVNPLLTPSITITSNPAMPLCPGSNVTFTATATNGGANPSYQWMVNGSTVGTNTNTYSSSTLVSGDVVSCALTSSENCLTTSNASSNSITISNYTPLSITAGQNVSVCEGTVVNLSATPTGGNSSSYAIVWQPSNSSSNPLSLTANSTTTYTATVTDGCGNTASSTVTLNVFQRPVAAFTFLPNPPNLETATQFTDASVNAVSWNWTFGSGLNSTLQNPSFSYATGGSYAVLLMVTSADGCTDTTISQFIIEDYISLYIPSAFTPDNDDINPIFFAYGEGITSFGMEIFNRWGMTVFTSNDIMKGWNGSLNNGILAEQGVYTYRVEVTFANNRTEIILGKLTLIR